MSQRNLIPFQIVINPVRVLRCTLPRYSNPNITQPSQTSEFSREIEVEPEDLLVKQFPKQTLDMKYIIVAALLSSASAWTIPKPTKVCVCVLIVVQEIEEIWGFGGD